MWGRVDRCAFPARSAPVCLRPKAEQRGDTAAAPSATEARLHTMRDTGLHLRQLHRGTRDGERRGHLPDGHHRPQYRRPETEGARLHYGDRRQGKQRRRPEGGRGRLDDLFNHRYELPKEEFDVYGIAPISDTQFIINIWPHVLSRIWAFGIKRMPPHMEHRHLPRFRETINNNSCKS